jgi:A/G-specific adenine glycosylase
MKLWAGLGYYSRARNLHTCAKVVVEQHGGVFPDREETLLTLPGVGPYTAAAIAAIAFDRRAVVVDGNVERVISRLFAIEEPLPAAKPLIKAKADLLTPDLRPGDYAQAMMDLGATICTPRRPACVLCPLRPFCAAAVSNEAETFPRKTPKTERPARSGAAFFIRRADGAVLVRSRPPKGLLGGMTEIPGTEWLADFDVSDALRDAPLKASYRKLIQTVEHVFTHFALVLFVFVTEVSQKTRAPEGCRWVSDAALDGEAFPSLMRKVISLARQNGV